MFNFSKFATDHRIPAITSGHHHTGEGWMQTHCPQCTNGTQGFHLGFNIQKGYFSCWRCGPLKLVEVIRGMVHVSVPKAWELRWQYDDGANVRVLHRQTAARTKAVPKPPGLGPLLPRHLRYLRDVRGLARPRAVAAIWGLEGTDHLGGKWAWRVVAPICNKHSQVVAYVGRSIFEVKSKYMLTENERCAEEPSGFLYGEHKVSGDTVIVVEGPGDVWNIGPGAVATLGIKWHGEQANKLRQYRKRFVMFDPEPLAQKQAHKLAEWLSMFPGETEIIDGLPSDPGNLPNEFVIKLRKEILGG